jgi:hypothetical protein
MWGISQKKDPKNNDPCTSPLFFKLMTSKPFWIRILQRFLQAPRYSGLTAFEFALCGDSRPRLSAVRCGRSLAVNVHRAGGPPLAPKTWHRAC